jgi:hypothetical protein
MWEAVESRERVAVVVVADPLLLSFPYFPFFPSIPHPLSPPLFQFPYFLVSIGQRGMGMFYYRLTLMFRERTVTIKIFSVNVKRIKNLFKIVND